MEFKFLHLISAFLSVAIVASHAALPSEEYWNSVLPNTPMPKAIKDLLQPVPAGRLEDKNVTVDVGGEIANMVKCNSSGSNVTVGNGGVTVKHGNCSVSVVPGGITVGPPAGNGKPYVRIAPGPEPFKYHYAATETQLHNNPNVALFFLEKDLHEGKKMNLQFSKTTNEATFLPRQVADSIPFSSNELPEIFNNFSVNPSSDEAKVMKKTIKECEDAGIKGEKKFCTTSLESMVDFSTSELGKDVTAISTIAENSQRKEYHIMGVKKMPSEKSVIVCHLQEYAYAVFYCHKTETTVAYKVAMVAAGGLKADAVAVCHQDTEAWNPKHLAFQVLNVKPGTVAVCHFLPEDHIVWVSKN